MIRGFVAAACAFGSSIAIAADPWVVRQFQVEGAQWISEGTVYNYLPINIGDTIDDQLRREAFRALYETGFFQDIEFRRDGDTLIIAVLERPRIEEFTFSGNEDIEDEQLEESLTGVGLSVGKTFDRSILDEVTQFLTDQYHAQGKYAAQVNPVVEPLPDNRVRVAIEIKEGDRAKIREINIIGNSVFDDDDLTENFDRRSAVVYSQRRSLLQGSTRGRSRNAALVLHGSRLCRLSNRVPAGHDLAGQT